MTTDTITDILEAEHGTSLWKDAWIRLRKNKLAVFGLGVLIFFIVIVLLTPWIAPYSESANVGGTWDEPSAKMLFGADQIGRDMLTRMMYGSRMTPPAGEPGRMESELLASTGLEPKQFKTEQGLHMKGLRRSLRIPLREVSLESVDETAYRVRFSLPPGSFATVLLAELTTIPPERS